MKRILFTLSLTFSLFFLTACHYLSFTRIKVQQGNLLKAKTVCRLKLGMHKTDVAILLGHSLLAPTFRNNRWDYAFTFQRNDGPILVKNLSLYFENDKLVKIVKQP